MEVLKTEIRITGIQVLGHTIIPFIWWLFLKSKQNFFNWIGLKTTENWKLSGVGIFLFFAIIAVSQVSLCLMLCRKALLHLNNIGKLAWLNSFRLSFPNHLHHVQG